MVTLSAAEMESTCYQCANGGQLGKWLRESGRKSLVEGVWLRESGLVVCRLEPIEQVVRSRKLPISICQSLC